MKKLIWQHEEPTEDGLYWYTSTIGAQFTSEKWREPMLLQVRGQSKYVSSHGGSDLSSLYNAKLFKEKGIKAFFARIPSPSETAKWQDFSIIKEHDTCAWFRDDEGYIGIGINLYPDSYAGSGRYVNGDYIWLDSPHNGGTYGDRVHESKGYEYIILKKPRVAVNKK